MTTYVFESKYTRGEVERTCPVCGGRFLAKAPKHTYCSTACKRKAIGKRIGRIGTREQCPECSRSFIVRASNQTYCSEKCRNKARGRRYYYERGGKEKMHDRAMTPRGKMLARMNARRKRERDKLRQIEIVERTRPLVKCEFCGELFGQGKSTQRFCSDQCRKKAWSSRNEDKVKAQQKRRYEEHRDEVLARRRERYWSNVEQSRRVKRIKYEARKMESEVD